MSSAPRSLADAHGRWCPFFRRSGYTDEGSYTDNRPHGMAAREAMCIGPECMAWRDVAPPPDAPPNEQWGVCDMMPGHNDDLVTIEGTPSPDELRRRHGG